MVKMSIAMRSVNQRHAAMLSNDQKQLLINVLLEKKNVGGKKRDSFIRGGSETAGIYTADLGNKTKYISNDMLSFINNNMSAVQIEGDEYIICNGIRYGIDQIPPVDVSNTKEVKAGDNYIDFGKNQYFKYISNDGKEHYLYTKNGSIGSIFSESLRGAPFDRSLERYARFWNYLSMAKGEEISFLTLEFPLKEVQGYLDQANIQPGFFTIKMGIRETTRFYSTSKNGVLVYSKERYDEHYESLTSGGNLLCKYEPGSVFRIKGKEYVLKEDHNLDIPYGEDIYDLEYPRNYWYGVKMD